jgi:hypothetical protein
MDKNTLDRVFENGKKSGISYTRKDKENCKALIQLLENIDQRFLPRLSDHLLDERYIADSLNRYIPLYIKQHPDSHGAIMKISMEQYKNKGIPFRIQDLADDYITENGDCFIDYTVQDTLAQVQAYKYLARVYQENDNQKDVGQVLALCTKNKIKDRWFVKTLLSFNKYNQNMKKEYQNLLDTINTLKIQQKDWISFPNDNIEITNDGGVSGWEGRLSIWNGKYERTKNSYRWKKGNLILTKNEQGQWVTFRDEAGIVKLTWIGTGWVNKATIDDIIIRANVEMASARYGNKHLRPTTPPNVLIRIIDNIIKNINNAYYKSDTTALEDIKMHLLTAYRNTQSFTHNFPYIYVNIISDKNDNEIIKACKEYNKY